MKVSEQAFTKLVHEHKRTIYSVCYMFSADEDEVADLFQEVLIRMWKGLATFEERSQMRTWIYRLSLNVCISYINLFEDRDEDSRQVNQLHDRISRLQPFDRAIVLLWLENMSYDEIGQVVGISTKNVSVRLYRIKEQLKRMSNDQ